jgi:hypothetical protein
VRVRVPRPAPLTVIVRGRVKRVPRGLPAPAPRRGPAEVTYENGVPVAATRVTGAPAFAAPHMERLSWRRAGLPGFAANGAKRMEVGEERMALASGRTALDDKVTGGLLIGG